MSSGQVQGRVLDSAEFRPLPVPADQPRRPARPARPRQPPAAAAEASAKITPAPDLIAAATHAASQALGWTSPDAVLASTLVAARAAA